MGASPDDASASSPRPSLLVLYGSETGNAQDAAERIARDANRRHYRCDVLAMDDYEVTELPRASTALFVTSTMGQGDPPANMKRFWRFLLRKSLPAASLAGVDFAVFGLGDSHYQKYNVAAKRLHKRLLSLGANPIAPLGLGDDQHPTGHEAALDPWLRDVWTSLRAKYPLRVGERDPADGEEATALERCRYSVEVVDDADAADGVDKRGNKGKWWRKHVASEMPTTPELCAAAALMDRVARAAARVDPRILRRGGGGDDGASTDDARASTRRFGPENPCFETTILMNAPLTSKESSHEVRHVVIDASGMGDAGTTTTTTTGGGEGGGRSPKGCLYSPGDSVAVLPTPGTSTGGQKACAAAAEELLRRAGVPSDAWITVRPNVDGGGDALEPAMPAMTLIMGALDLTSASPRRYFFEVAAHFASDAAEKERLTYFASAEGRDDLYRYNERERRSVIEFLDDFKSVNLPLPWAFRVAPRLRARLFSLSSSPSSHANELHCTVSLVKWKTHYGRAREGLCSNYLARLAPGASVATWIVPGTLRLPPDASTPMIVVCTGSGVAPFRSFAHERAAMRARGDKLAPTLVFFGCRHREHDCLYEREWAVFDEPRGVLAGDVDVPGAAPPADAPADGPRWFVPAFSRDAPDGSKDYVTHRIIAHGARVWAMIAAGASVYVAGSTGRMPEDVSDAFEAVAVRHGGLDAAAARAHFARMDATGKYSVEAW